MKIASLFVALLLVPLACGPGPVEVPPPDVPAPAPIDEVAFVTEVHGAKSAAYPNGRPLVRQVSLTVAAIQANGEIAQVTDPETGKLRPGPLFIIRATPWRHAATLTPGIVSISMTAVYLGVRDERLSCYVQKDGVTVPDSYRENQITVVGGGERGGTQVVCAY